MSPLEYIDFATRQLQRQIEEFRETLSRMVETRKLPACSTCLLSDYTHKVKLRETIREVIEVLKSTKKAFKSKRLGVMRERLIKVVAEWE